MIEQRRSCELWRISIFGENMVETKSSTAPINDIALFPCLHALPPVYMAATGEG
jgi:hypothetical protein